MTQLVKIGNSQGVRIPKPVIQQAHLAGKTLQFKVVRDGLLISPLKQQRQGWQQSIEQTLASQKKAVADSAWLDMPLDA